MEKIYESTNRIKTNLRTIGKENAVANCLKYNEEITVHAEPLLLKKNKDYSNFREQTPKINIYNGYFTEVRDLISPKPKTFYQRLIEETRESNLKDVDSKQYNKSKINFDSTMSFGKPNDYGEGGGTVINQKKTTAEIDATDRIGHKLYKKSHNNFDLNERRYQGIIEIPDYRIAAGKSEIKNISVDKILEWIDQKPLTATSNRQASHHLRTKYELGKGLQPNLSDMAEKQIYKPISNREDFGVRELLTEGEPNKELSQLCQSLIHVNSIRHRNSKQYPPFPHLEFKNYLQKNDLGFTGFINKETVYDICREYGIIINKSLLEPLMIRCNVLCSSELVNYENFMGLILPNYPFPNINKIKHLSKDFLLYETTYQSMNNDLKSETINSKVAGISTNISTFDSSNILNLKNFLGETNADVCLRPSIFIQYGLNYQDFRKPRTKDVIRQIFNAFIEISDEIFETLWNKAAEIDQNELVCVETFKNILNESLL